MTASTGPGRLYYLRARYYEPSSGQFLSRDPIFAQTREAYAYVQDNVLNKTDPTGLFGWNDLKTIAKAVVTAPAAVLTSEVLNAESVIGFFPYAVYYGAYRLNKAFPNSPVPGFNGTMSWLQRVGLHGDEAWDRFEQWSGYPGASENDEDITVNVFPSVIYPTCPGGNWRQNKFTYGPTTKGPGRGPNGHEDYAD